MHVLCSADIRTVLHNIENQELNKLQNWFELNKLTLIVSNTSFMFLGEKEKLPGD